MEALLYAFGYLVAGVMVSVAFTIFGKNTRSAYDQWDMGMAVFLWPFLVVILIVSLAGRLVAWIVEWMNRA